MLRLQAPIPERFIADDPANDARIRAAREAEVKELTFLLWRGHCSVHQRFTPALVDAFRSEFGIGTEIPLVSRLAAEHPDKRIVSLDPMVCPCSTMFRIDSAHLAWILEGLVEGRVENRITVDGETARWARVALDRMLSIT